METGTRRRALALIALSFLTAAACTPKKTIKPLPDAAKTDAAKKADADAAAQAAIPNIEWTQSDIRGAEFVSTEGIKTIYFDYDSASLKGDALDTLKKNAEYLKKNPELDVLAAGFCDERGTVEYNLALGQKRAKEVRDYYIRLGVSGKSVATISYGKESPACPEHTEECWAKSRRVETRVRSRTVSAPQTQDDNAR